MPGEALRTVRTIASGILPAEKKRRVHGALRGIGGSGGADYKKAAEAARRKKAVLVDEGVFGGALDEDGARRVLRSSERTWAAGKKEEGKEAPDHSILLVAEEVLESGKGVSAGQGEPFVGERYNIYSDGERVLLSEPYYGCLFT